MVKISLNMCIFTLLIGSLFMFSMINAENVLLCFTKANYNALDPPTIAVGEVLPPELDIPANVCGPTSADSNKCIKPNVARGYICYDDQTSVIVDNAECTDLATRNADWPADCIAECVLGDNSKVECTGDLWWPIRDDCEDIVVQCVDSDDNVLSAQNCISQSIGAAFFRHNDDPDCKPIEPKCGGDDAPNDSCVCTASDRPIFTGCKYTDDTPFPTLPADMPMSCLVLGSLIQSIEACDVVTPSTTLCYDPEFEDVPAGVDNADEPTLVDPEAPWYESCSAPQANLNYISEERDIYQCKGFSFERQYVCQTSYAPRSSDGRVYSEEFKTLVASGNYYTNGPCDDFTPTTGQENGVPYVKEDCAEPVVNCYAVTDREGEQVKIQSDCFDVQSDICNGSCKVETYTNVGCFYVSPTDSSKYDFDTACIEGGDALDLPTEDCSEYCSVNCAPTFPTEYSQIVVDDLEECIADLATTGAYEQFTTPDVCGEVFTREILIKTSWDSFITVEQCQGCTDAEECLVIIPKKCTDAFAASLNDYVTLVIPTDATTPKIDTLCPSSLFTGYCAIGETVPAEDPDSNYESCTCDSDQATCAQNRRNKCFINTSTDVQTSSYVSITTFEATLITNGLTEDEAGTYMNKLETKCTTVAPITGPTPAACPCPAGIFCAVDPESTQGELGSDFAKVDVCNDTVGYDCDEAQCGEAPTSTRKLWCREEDGTFTEVTDLASLSPTNCSTLTETDIPTATRTCPALICISKYLCFAYGQTITWPTEADAIEADLDYDELIDIFLQDYTCDNNAQYSNNCYTAGATEADEPVVITCPVSTTPTDPFHIRATECFTYNSATLEAIDATQTATECAKITGTDIPETEITCTTSGGCPTTTYTITATTTDLTNIVYPTGQAKVTITYDNDFLPFKVYAAIASDAVTSADNVNLVYVQVMSFADETSFTTAVTNDILSIPINTLSVNKSSRVFFKFIIQGRVESTEYINDALTTYGSIIYYKRCADTTCPGEQYKCDDSDVTKDATCICTNPEFTLEDNCNAPNVEPEDKCPTGQGKLVNNVCQCNFGRIGTSCQFCWVMGAFTITNPSQTISETYPTTQNNNAQFDQSFTATPANRVEFLNGGFDYLAQQLSLNRINITESARSYFNTTTNVLTQVILFIGECPSTNTNTNPFAILQQTQSQIKTSYNDNVTAEAYGTASNPGSEATVGKSDIWDPTCTTCPKPSYVGSNPDCYPGVDGTDICVSPPDPEPEDKKTSKTTIIIAIVIPVVAVLIIVIVIIALCCCCSSDGEDRGHQQVSDDEEKSTKKQKRGSTHATAHDHLELT